MRISRRHLIGTGGLAIVGAMAAPSFAATRQGAATDPLAFVDPELRPSARQYMQFQSRMPDPEKALPLMRASGGRPLPPPLPTPPFYEQMVSVRGGPDVKVYVINARAGAPRPAILHTHGGGYIAGSARESIPTCQDIARQLDCVVATVEYRLAPEARWSASVEENYAGLKWLHDNADKLGVDRSRIAVMGESAGGGHAALLALRARDRREIPLALQVLIYPMLDDRTGSTRQPPAHIGFVGWNAASNRFGWRSFLGQAPGGPNVPRDAVPARAASLAGLAPAYIAVGSIDLFVDEDIEYARRLIAAGVPTELHVTPGGYHGFDGAAGTAIAKRFTAAKMEALRRAFRLSA